MKDFKLSNQFVCLNNEKMLKISEKYDDYQEIIDVLLKENIIKKNRNWIFLYDLIEHEYENSKKELKKCYIIKKIINNNEYVFSIPAAIVKRSKKGIFYYYNLFDYLKKFVISTKEYII